MISNDENKGDQISATFLYRLVMINDGVFASHESEITNVLQSLHDLVIRNRVQDTVWMSLLLYLKDSVDIFVDILRRLDLQHPISP